MYCKKRITHSASKTKMIAAGRIDRPVSTATIEACIKGLIGQSTKINVIGPIISKKEWHRGLKTL